MMSHGKFRSSGLSAYTSIDVIFDSTNSATFTAERLVQGATDTTSRSAERAISTTPCVPPDPYRNVSIAVDIPPFLLKPGGCPSPPPAGTGGQVVCSMYSGRGDWRILP